MFFSLSVSRFLLQTFYPDLGQFQFYVLALPLKSADATPSVDFTQPAPVDNGATVDTYELTGIKARFQYGKAVKQHVLVVETH